MSRRLQLSRILNGAQVRSAKARAGARRHRQLVVEGLERREMMAADPVLSPSYFATFADAVTADNVVRGRDGMQYWTVDAGADNYSQDFYERPTAQTYQVRRLTDGTSAFAAAEYFENLDIVEARAGFDANYLYVSLRMAGANKVQANGARTAEGLVYRYGLRLSNSASGANGMLLVVDSPALKNAPREFNGDKAFVYADRNGDVGGRGLLVTKSDSSAESAGNGFETVVASDGKLSNGSTVLWTRVHPSDANVVEFVVNYKALGFSAADLGRLPYLQFEAVKGLKDPGNYLWNDEYTKSEAGSPYRATQGDRSKSEFGTQGLGNIYELDTLVGGALAATTGSLSGSVYIDLNENGLRDADEPGIAGVLLMLYGTDSRGNHVELMATTDASGAYRFDDLAAGVYSIYQFQPGEYNDGAETIGSLGGELGQDEIYNIVLADGEDGLGYDFGEALFINQS